MTKCDYCPKGALHFLLDEKGGEKAACNDCVGQAIGKRDPASVARFTESRFVRMRTEPPTKAK